VFSGSDISSPLKVNSSRFLKKITVKDLSPESLSELSLPPRGESVFEFVALLDLPIDGKYLFSIESAYGACLSIDGKMMLDDVGEKPAGGAVLDGGGNFTAGLHSLSFRYDGGAEPFRLTWRRLTGLRTWHPIPAERLFLPAN
jgi:hypothetical protein